MTDDLETALARAGAAYGEARAHSERRYAEVLPLIHEARNQGLTLRRIAALSGLSLGRIHQLTAGASGKRAPARVRTRDEGPAAVERGATIVHDGEASSGRSGSRV